MKQIFDSMALELAKAAAEVSELSFMTKGKAIATNEPRIIINK